MFSKSDFHLHSVYSDWSLTVNELDWLLSDVWVEYYSITDHDSVWACIESRELTKTRRNWPRSIPWIEITTLYKSKILHLLAYGFNPNNCDLIRFLEQQRRARRDRAIDITTMLNQDLIKEEKTPIPIEEILKLETEWPITRPDIANYLMKIWYVQTFQEAFDNWLRRYDVPLTTSDINQTIGLIRDIGWTSVLAHAFAPHVSIQSITKDAVQQIQILTELKKAWLHWLELYYSDYENNPHSQISHTINMADELNLLVTGGSDFHGGGRTGITLPWVSFPYHRVQTFLEEVHK